MSTFLPEDFKRVRAERGWSQGQLGDVLKSHGEGRGFSASQIGVYESGQRPIPENVGEALRRLLSGAEPSAEPPTPPPSPGAVGGSQRVESEGPRMPAGARLVEPTKDAPVVAPVNRQLARQRISQLHATVGSAMAFTSGNPGYGAVLEDAADPIADAWLRAAEENRLAARFVEIMQAGGATGELVVCYAMLTVNLVYVSGRAGQLESTPLVNARWKVFHDRAVAERLTAEDTSGSAAAPSNGAAAGAHPGGAVGYAPGEAGA